ncbi:MAG: triose-phosphate isomerase [bacterium]|nr:triose-phosphate isomerase [bacterium]
MKRRYLIAGNWKMNKTIGEAVELATKIKTGLTEIDDIDIAIFPPFTALYPVYEVIKESNINLGAQNLWYESNGAYTGEISPIFIVDVGCKYVIIGHSERRQYCGETAELVNRKLKTALKYGLISIVCIGETIEERENGKTYELVEREFNVAFDGLLPGTVPIRGQSPFLPITIAYEPIWAIGTGFTATPKIAEEVHKFIRKLVETKYGYKVAEEFRILYGGSVNSETISGLLREPDIDGVLVGGASLDAKSFIEIVKKANSI